MTDAPARPDLRPAAGLVARVVREVADDQLDGPTPCPGMSVATMLDHVAGFAFAFTYAARQEPIPGGSQPPSSDGDRLDPAFRERIPEALTGLGEAWQEPAAWTGMTRAGGVDLPGEVAGLVAMDEVVVHGWDVAVATGQDYDPPVEAIEAALGFVRASVTQNPDGTPGLFARPVEVAADAPALHQLLALTGRDPHWRP